MAKNKNKKKGFYIDLPEDGKDIDPKFTIQLPEGDRDIDPKFTIELPEAEDIIEARKDGGLVGRGQGKAIKIKKTKFV